MNQLSLRPNNFLEFVGQKKLVVTIQAMIKGSRTRNETLDHILFYGPPGTGKTSLATIVANELDVKIHYLQGSLIEKKSDILSVFANINDHDIIFIDEIHSINKNVEEIIYNAMEDFTIDIILGPEGNSKVMRMNLKPFTLIGATTKPNLISQPFKDRFGFHARLSPYDEDDIVEILKRSRLKLGFNVQDDVLRLITKYSRATPRVANHLLKRAFDFSLKNNGNEITMDSTYSALKYLELYDYGLTRDHIDYLELLNNVFNSQYVSIDSISGILNINKDNLINDIEPYLLYLKFIEKSPRGRRITTKGIDYLLKVHLNIRQE
ncbi:Holliday junction branch migration DNA helicase RuvB [Mycoplasmopsis adleri]|uniref:Holliday junction branch migration DNA helicase RuvB n=1 Tax=Mycoplasmopsis adleri TaxID=51362 RepID=UPI00387379DB